MNDTRGRAMHASASSLTEASEGGRSDEYGWSARFEDRTQPL